MEKSEETGAGGQNDWNLKSWMGAIVKHRNSHGGSLKISPGPLAQSRLTPDRHLQHIHGKQLVYQPSGSNEAPDVDQHLGWFFGFLRCRRMSGRYQEMNRWVHWGSKAWQLGSLWLDGTVVWQFWDPRGPRCRSRQQTWSQVNRNAESCPNLEIPTCPRAVLKDNCQAGKVLKKKLTVRAEKIKMAEELEILGGVLMIFVHWSYA